MSRVRSFDVRAQTVIRARTGQNFSHCSREHKMLISIELARERTRDIERQAADLHRVDLRGVRRPGRNGRRRRGSWVVAAFRPAKP